jgi:NADP-dependent 3-hydroxy acid dehydrogenase YdfG
MIVLITGATAGIGKATAELFAKNGHQLIITGRRKDRLEALKKELETAYKVQVLTLDFDVTKLAEVQAALGKLPEAFRNVDLLVNNAGLASGLSSIQEGDIEDWEKMINTNVKGLLYVTRIIAPGMVERKKGHIINISSIAGKEVYANGNVYCASKHAVDALNKAMRIDMLQHNIRVTSINPGMIETEFSLVRFHGDEKKAKQVYQGLTPLSAEDIAETIYWTASRPAHVNINEIIIMPTAQATAANVVRK